ncbi:MAG: type 4a pilus biogenesis protein PilO [Polaromonas sp.]|jgi:type IV pilus assembly protein PilO
MLNSLQHLRRQLESMNRDAPMAWPAWLRLLTQALVCWAVVGMLWWLILSADQQALMRAEAAHERLRAEFSAKLLRAAPLSALQSQQAWLQQRLALLEQPLPGAREIDLLLSDVNRAGRERSLRFELLRPAELTLQPLYAQQRIALRVVGRYQDLAAFATDLAGLAWSVSIQSFTLKPAPDGVLVMEAVVRTLRPLSQPPSQMTGKGVS